jgi:hypothetical protein
METGTNMSYFHRLLSSNETCGVRPFGYRRNDEVTASSSSHVTITTHDVVVEGSAVARNEAVVMVAVGKYLVTT